MIMAITEKEVMIFEIRRSSLYSFCRLSSRKEYSNGASDTCVFQMFSIPATVSVKLEGLTLAIIKVMIG